MPELPEVEVVCRALADSIIKQTIKSVEIYNYRLRYPIPADLATLVTGQAILAVSRRGKYLIFALSNGNLIWHLGMSGVIQVYPSAPIVNKHDHVVMIFTNDLHLKFTDPRRFGLVLWSATEPMQHKLLRKLGPEPLSSAYSPTYLATQAQHRNIGIKQFLMDSSIVVGIGNIYANEILFACNIHPSTPVPHLDLAAWDSIHQASIKILEQAITTGGTTIKDYRNTFGSSGSFQQHLQAYGRAGLNCYRCHNIMQAIKIAQRATVFCPQCQAPRH